MVSDVYEYLNGHGRISNPDDVSVQQLLQRLTDIVLDIQKDRMQEVHNRIQLTPVRCNRCHPPFRPQMFSVAV